MAFKLIQVAVSEERLRAILAAADELAIDDVQVAPPLEDGRRLVSLVVGETDRQGLLDRLQGALGKSENWRIAILPTDTVIAEKIEEPGQRKDDEKADAEKASREELFNLVAGGTRLDSTFLLLVFLSTVVASVGLEGDSVAVIIGAMVIAPLLGPNVAFAFGAAIGDRGLMLSAARSNLVGVGLSILVAAGLTLLLAPNVASHELLARTSLDYAGLALGLASGAAAALSVTTGLPSTLVGVMVAVALLPPAATVGIMAAAQRPQLAIGATLLLVGNIACVNLAAQIVFLATGIRPRRWQEQKIARRAAALNILTWVATLVILAVVIGLRQGAFAHVD